MEKFNQDDIFLVTGASSGIGQNVALKLNELGAKVIATGRSIEKLQETKTLSKYNENILIEQKELTENINDLANWVKSLKDKYGKIRGLICIAGQDFPNALQVLDEEKSKKIFDINYFAPVFLAKGFADRRVNSGSNASITFVASTAAVQPEKGQTIYAASKAALIASAKSISKELASKGIRVNCVSPAYVETPMYYKNLQTIGTNIDQYPLGIGKPSDIAAIITFLVSDEARWITGQNYILDGGYL